MRFKTRTNSTTFTDANILALMKIRQDEIACAVMEVDEDILLIPQTANLVANQRSYAFPSDMLSKIKRVEAAPDGTNWLKFSYMDMTEFQHPLTESNITSYFSNNEGDCFYDLYRKALYLMCGTVSTLASGLKVWVNTYPSAITDLTGSTDMSVDPSTTTHGVPRELHEIWARGVIIDFKESRERPLPLTEREQKYEYDKNKAIYSLKNQDLDRQVIGHLPASSERGNDGQDY